MTLAQFLEHFQPVMEAFDARKFPQIVLERIHVKVHDLTPTEMRELCNEIIDRCEHAPRTAKVAEFANIIRARHKVGLNEAYAEIMAYCDFCDDLGVIRAVATDQTHETLMRCECSDDRDKSNWNLPKWTRHWAPLYSKNKCPLSWFKPVVFNRPDGTMKLEESIDNRRTYWREKVRIAEQFWIHQRKEAANE